MKADKTPNTKKRVAKTLGILVFCFMSIVSVVIISTEEHLTIVDYSLIIGMPIVMSALAYFVGLHHDPKAFD